MRYDGDKIIYVKDVKDLALKKGDSVDTVVNTIITIIYLYYLLHEPAFTCSL